MDVRIDGSNCLLVITSDHGMNNVESENLIMLDKIYPKLLKYLRRDVYGMPLVSGSPRNAYLHIKEGYFDKVMKMLDGLKDDAIILDRRKTINSLFKDINPSVIDRLGDIIILPKPGYGFWVRHYKKERLNLRGMHGGLSSDEIYIPFLAIRLDMLNSINIKFQRIS